jgi:transcriptional regulator
MIKERKTRGPKPGVLRDAPYHPERVLKIVKLRQSGLTLAEVGEMFGITPAGVSHLVERWGTWAQEQAQ